MTALAVRDLGTGPPVLALHGAYSAGVEVAGFLPAMLPGHRLLIPDLPGHGDSPADGVASAADVVDRLDALVEESIGTEPVAVVGLEPDLAEAFTGYFVVRTATTLARFLDAVVPALGPHHTEAVGRQLEHSELDLDDPAADRPTLVLTARHDAWVGYRQHEDLLAAYPRATSIVVADAGHALPHERPELVAAALRDWLARC